MKILFVTESSVRRAKTLQILSDFFTSQKWDVSIKIVGYNRFNLEDQEAAPVSLVILDLEPERSLKTLFSTLSGSKGVRPSAIALYPVDAPSIVQACQTHNVACLATSEGRLGDSNVLTPFLQSALANLVEIQPEQVQEETQLLQFA